MGIVLDHTIIPARDKEASARFLARILGLRYESSASHFAPVRVNDSLTLDFDTDNGFESHHYAFKVGESEFDDIDVPVLVPVLVSHRSPSRSAVKVFGGVESVEGDLGWRQHHTPFSDAGKPPPTYRSIYRERHLRYGPTAGSSAACSTDVVSRRRHNAFGRFVTLRTSSNGLVPSGRDDPT